MTMKQKLSSKTKKVYYTSQKHLNRSLYRFKLTKDLVNTTIWLEH